MGNRAAKPSLSHLDARGKARMVDVGAKPITIRRAVAIADVVMSPATLAALTTSALPKGDVLAAARIAGIMAAKRTAELIPLCHVLSLEQVAVDFERCPPHTIRITAVATVHARTGVEMEALTAAAVAALTIYDMCKAIDRGMTIGPIQLIEKSGGRSGHWRRDETPGNFGQDTNTGGAARKPARGSRKSARSQRG